MLPWNAVMRYDLQLIRLKVGLANTAFFSKKRRKSAFYSISTLAARASASTASSTGNMGSSFSGYRETKSSVSQLYLAGFACHWTIKSGIPFREN